MRFHEFTIEIIDPQEENPNLGTTATPEESTVCLDLGQVVSFYWIYDDNGEDKRTRITLSSGEFYTVLESYQYVKKIVLGQ